jgi:hypothetical protein
MNAAVRTQVDPYKAAAWQALHSRLRAMAGAAPQHGPRQPQARQEGEQRRRLGPCIAGGGPPPARCGAAPGPALLLLEALSAEAVVLGPGGGGARASWGPCPGAWRRA